MGQSGTSLKGSGELLTSIKRYYSNAFTDRVKQDAINLFLGHFVPIQSKTSLWELESDYHLHNKNLRHSLHFADELLLNQSPSRLIDNTDSDTDAGIDNMRGVGTITHQYVIKPSIDQNLAVSVISRKEIRKLEHTLRSMHIEKALQEWWRLSIHEYESRRMWMCLPKTQSSSEHKLKSFSRQYKPYKLTSFDSIIAEDEFSCPIVLEVSNFKKRKGLTSSSKTDLTSSEAGEAGVEAGDTGVGMFGKMFGQIGMRARHLVGGFGFMRRDDATDRGSSPTNSDMKYSAREGRYSVHTESVVDDYVYEKYVDVEGKLTIQRGYGSCEHEFEECMKELSIEVDDAKSMQDLSKNAYIGYTVDSGPYSGMRYTAFASSEYSGSVLLNIFSFFVAAHNRINHYINPRPLQALYSVP